MGHRKRQIKWMRSIQTKQIFSFTLIVILLMILTYLLQAKAISIATETTYEKMSANTGYYLSTFENEIAHVRNLQLDFLNDRRLAFLVSPIIMISDYERREYLLSVRERLSTVTGVSDLVSDGILYLPKSGYKITQSAVLWMDETDYAIVQTYMEYNRGGLSYDGNEFFFVETGVPRIQADYTPNHMLIITFSQEAVRRSMDALSTTDGSGAFFSWNENVLMLESTNGEGVGAEIYANLARNETGDPFNVQRLLVGEDWYLAFVESDSELGLFVQYTKEEPIMRSIYQFRIQVFIVIGFMAAISVIFAIYTRRIVHKPIDELLKAFTEVKTGNWSKRIYHEGENEFSYLYESFNDMVENTERLINEVYIQTNLVQQAQLKHLQVQINPHFLYNSFFTLSRRVKRHDYEGARELTEHLGNYFQFLTRDASDYIPLGQEVEHAKSYAAIQGTRFVKRLSIQFEDLPEQYQFTLVPRLILQPLLENAFEHGLEHTIKDGLLQISFQDENGALLIHVEDNGQDITDEEILTIQKKLIEEKIGETTGICNIHRRLRIYFKEHSGLRITRSDLGGMRVTIVIVNGGKNNESKSINC